MAPYENTWIAFDTTHNHGSAPQTDDYLFHPSDMFPLYRGNGTHWIPTGPKPSGFQANSSSSGWGPGLQPSPKNFTPHRIEEFRIPLTHVGQINQTIGFYFIVVDDSTDPDGWGANQPPTGWVEWPAGAGGDPRGWPSPPEYIDPCPAPSTWGYLTFLQRPTASFTYSPEVPDVNETVIFDASVSQDPDGTIVNYTWNFGDGNITSVLTPLIIHTFSAAGRYDVNLTVTDNDGLNNSVVHTITVGVMAAFTFSPSAPNPGDVVTFNATASYSRLGTIVSYTWDFGDGNITMVDVAVITHAFSTGGSYDVNLTVTDETGLNGSVVHTINVGVPMADFTFWPSAPNLGDAVIFDASASQDPDGTIVSYTWDFGDGNITMVDVAVITHIFSTTGNYNVNLTVTDNLGLKGSVVDAVTVYAPREAHFSFSPSTPNVGDVVTFNASLSKDPGGTIVNYTWNFDDGNITTVNVAVIAHVFSLNGSYNVNLTITDNDGLKSWYNNTVNVGIPPVQATAPYSPIIPTIDGIRGSLEWADANEYIINGTGGEGYILVKRGPGNVTGEFLYILVDSPWDTTPPSVFPSESTWIAFDTEHDKSTVGPQPDDYLLNSAYSSWNRVSWRGNGTMWMGMETPAGMIAVQSYDSGHRIEEMRIPLAYVGVVNQTSGFYVMVVDDSGDPDRTGPKGSDIYVEWPNAAGGDSWGWPVLPDYIDPCPTLDKWGYLFLEPQTLELSNVTLDISPSSITLGESVTITVTVSNSTGAIAWVDVIIQCKLTGATVWTNITTVTTSSTGSYAYNWKPTEAGTYEIRAIWSGDAYNYGAESEIKTLKVTSEAIPILLIIAVLAVIVVAVAIAVYLLKVKKPKGQS
jgi:PKD repeat protein